MFTLTAKDALYANTVALWLVQSVYATLTIQKITKMEKDKIFFGESGLTTTSANYIANLAKEAYQRMERELSLVKFYSIEIGLLGSNETKSLRKGIDEADLLEIPVNLNLIASYKSLIAWLREAIKAKERLIKEMENLSIGDVCSLIGLELPEKPKEYKRLSKDDVVASWNIKQRNRYYYLDTICAVIGSYIHPDGTFSEQREALHRILVETNKVEGNGRDMVIYTYTPSVSVDLIEDTFFKLQKHYREYQAELNSIKYSIEVALQEDEREKSTKEKEEYLAFSTKYQEVCKEARLHQTDLLSQAQALKIIIPDSLKPVYETISKIGK